MPAPDPAPCRPPSSTDPGRLDRLEGCVIVAFGIPIVLLIVTALTCVIWMGYADSHSAFLARCLTTAALIGVVALATARVITLRRHRDRHDAGGPVTFSDNK